MELLLLDRGWKSGGHRGGSWHWLNRLDRLRHVLCVGVQEAGVRQHVQYRCARRILLFGAVDVIRPFSSRLRQALGSAARPNDIWEQDLVELFVIEGTTFEGAGKWFFL